MEQSRIVPSFVVHTACGHPVMVEVGEPTSYAPQGVQHPMPCTLCLNAALEAVARAAEEVRPEHEPVADCCPMCRLKIASAKLREVPRG